MPILVDRGPAGCSIVASKDTASQRLQARRHPAGSEWIEIALYTSSALYCGSDVRLTT